MIDRATRDVELEQMLRQQRSQLQDQVRTGMREERVDRTKEVSDLVDDSDAVIQHDLTFALLQLRGDMVATLDEALVQLKKGHHGACLSCGCDISKPRLRALPFAVRCRACAAKREEAEGTGLSGFHRRAAEPPYGEVPAGGS